MTIHDDIAIYHICTRHDVHEAHVRGAYRAESLARDGFIHLSRTHQVGPTAKAYFAGVADLVVLVIDPTRLSAPLRYEPPAPLPSRTPKPAHDELYPHCYGPIDLAAIVDVRELADFTGVTS